MENSTGKYNQKEINALLQGVEGETKNALLMHSLNAVYIHRTVDGDNDTKLGLANDIKQMIDSISFDQLLLVYSLLNQFGAPLVATSLQKNDDVTVAQKSVVEDRRQVNKNVSISGEEKDKAYKKGYDAGSKKGYKDGYETGLAELQEMKKELQSEIYDKAKSEDNIELSNAAFQKGYDEGFRKAKELRIKELKKMREWPN
ncbi:hypothetical protein [Bacillus cereus]|uniref:hypothetical protein n=1 Tax=Bacillus cereus TaxID=1396 RepID=UPI000B4B6646|nr:hypothetical protein [Bacillus cereus]